MVVVLLVTIIISKRAKRKRGHPEDFFSPLPAGAQTEFETENLPYYYNYHYGDYDDDAHSCCCCKS